MANFTRFLNGDWVVLASELKKKGDIDKCQWFCVMHVEPSPTGTASKDTIYVEGYEDIEPVHLYSYAEDFVPAGQSEQDVFAKEKTSTEIICNLIATSDTGIADKQGIVDLYEESLAKQEEFLNGKNDFDSTGYVRINAPEMAVCA